MAQIFAEIHGKVSQVFQNDAVVLVSQHGDALQFLLVEAHPRRVVGVGIDDAADVATSQNLLQLLNERLATIVVNIQSEMLQANHVTLRGLHGEARMNEQYRVLLWHRMVPSRESGESALH